MVGFPPPSTDQLKSSVAALPYQPWLLLYPKLIFFFSQRRPQTFHLHFFFVLWLSFSESTPMPTQSLVTWSAYLLMKEFFDPVSPKMYFGHAVPIHTRRKHIFCAPIYPLLYTSFNSFSPWSLIWQQKRRTFYTFSSQIDPNHQTSHQMLPFLLRLYWPSWEVR